MSSTYDRLASLLAGFSVDRFMNEVLSVEPLHLRGPAERFQELMTWDALNQLLVRPMDELRVRLVRDGHPAGSHLLRYSLESANAKAARSSRLRLSALFEGMRHGATLIVDEVDSMHPPVTRLAEELESEFGDTVLVNLYATVHTSRGFRMHWDEHDILVLQVYGHKRWRVHEPTRPAPLRNDVEPAEPPTGDPNLEFEMGPGDLLYLPRGYWHYAVPLGGPTLHLSVGIHRRTGIHFMRWLTNEMRRSELFRSYLPRTESREILLRHVDAMRDELLQKWDSGAIDAFYREHDAKAVPRGRANLPGSAADRVLPTGDNIEVRLDLIRPTKLDPAMLPETGGLLHLHGVHWELTGEEMKLVRILCDGRWQPIRDLCSTGIHGLTEPRARAALDGLCAKGLVRTRAREEQ